MDKYLESLTNVLSHAPASEEITYIEKEIVLLLTKQQEDITPYGLYIKAMYLHLFENNLSGKNYDIKYNELINLSALACCKEAQYTKACIYYENKQYSDALTLYKDSMKQGYAPSLWCYGLDTFCGLEGILSKDEETGIKYIKLSAGLCYEYALEFLIDAYKNGKGIIKKDSLKADFYENILQMTMSE